MNYQGQDTVVDLIHGGKQSGRMMVSQYSAIINTITRPKTTHPPEAYDLMIGRTLRERIVYEECSSGQIIFSFPHIKEGAIAQIVNLLEKADGLSFIDFEIKNMQFDKVETYYSNYKIAHNIIIHFQSDLIEEPISARDTGEIPKPQTAVQEFLNGQDNM